MSQIGSVDANFCGSVFWAIVFDLLFAGNISFPAVAMVIIYRY